MFGIPIIYGGEDVNEKAIKSVLEETGVSVQKGLNVKASLEYKKHEDKDEYIASHSWELNLSVDFSPKQTKIIFDVALAAESIEEADNAREVLLRMSRLEMTMQFEELLKTVNGLNKEKGLFQ